MLQINSPENDSLTQISLNMMDRDIKCLTQYDWNDSAFMKTKIGPRNYERLWD